MDPTKAALRYIQDHPGCTAEDVANNCDITTNDAALLIRDLGGVKFDADKPRYDLIPPEVEEAMAVVLAFGAKKYAVRNWEKGMAWGRVYRALRSHMNKWWRRIPADDESGYSHLWHAACCIAFLVTYEQRGIGHDDRAPPHA